MDLVDAVAGAGVGATVVVQTLNNADETAELLAVDCDLIAGVVGSVHLVDPAVADHLDAPRLVGIRHQIQAEHDPAGWLAQPAVQRGLRALGAAGLAYDLMIRPAQFDVAARTVAAHPELRFVLDHLGKPPIADGPIGPWADGIRALARFPNLYCKLSGMVTVADHSRWPVCLIAADYRGVVDLAVELTGSLTSAERESVLDGTAQRVYRLAGS